MNSTVETYSTESGAEFQIYGKSNGQATPKINISNTNINANGIVSSDLADVSLNNVTFNSQHSNRNAITVENGSVVIDNSRINHNLFISRHPNTSIVARNSYFTNNIGTNVPNVILEGNISQDITN